MGVDTKHYLTKTLWQRLIPLFLNGSDTPTIQDDAQFVRKPQHPMVSQFIITITIEMGINWGIYPIFKQTRVQTCWEKAAVGHLDQAFSRRLK